MLTDRCATMCLLATLGSFYPNFLFVFQIVMVVDISCHWVHLHTSNVLGKTSHKNVDEEENALLRFYYTNRQFLFFMCAGNELFYSMLYLLHFTYGWTSKYQFFSYYLCNNADLLHFSLSVVLSTIFPELEAQISLMSSLVNPAAIFEILKKFL